MYRDISIHAPPRGATRSRAKSTPLPRYFNSRPSARGDKQCAVCGRRPSISIHAPPRGATIKERGWLRGYAISIHAPPRGATIQSTTSSPSKSFQFTPLREGRRHIQRAPHHSHDFNSRPSARGDLEVFAQDVEFLISIHAPPRGATANPADVVARRKISIHAPPRGATAKDMQFLQIFCSTLTNQHGLTIVPRNLSRLFW